MNKLRQVSAILKSINNHPLAGKHWIKAYCKFFYWQIGGFINPGEKKLAFTDRCFLLAKKGMAGATGNIYMGLHEFADMGFLLHFLRPDDLFFDIGANIGSYMVLASGHVGARTFAFEPVPATFQALDKNISVNDIKSLVKPYNLGVGSKKGKLFFTDAHDTVNHVIPNGAGDVLENTIEVNIVSVDDVVTEIDIPVLIKIDVEGFETEVINGMHQTLHNERLKAIIIELNGSGGRYGYDENELRGQLTNMGFKPYGYDPFTRQLTELTSCGDFNTIYLRDIGFVKHRIENAEKVSLFSENF